MARKNPAAANHRQAVPNGRQAARAAPPSSGALSREAMVEAYRLMLLSRLLDERVYALNRQGKVPIVASAQGHEACQIGAAWAMDRGRDLFVIYYRDIATCLTLGYSVTELMLGYMARRGAPFSGGRQFPYGGADLKRRVINTSNVVASQIPHAVGAALAYKMRREPSVAIVHFGDGATSEGETHESMNFAAVHKLPVIFFCENNGYAISVPLRKQMALARISDRAAAYGFPGVTVDGTDVLATYLITKEAADRARRGEGPTLIDAVVPRLMPHTTDDDERRYRTADEMEERTRRDPLPRLRQLLTNGGLLTPDRDDAMRQQCITEIDQATAAAESTPYPDESTFYDHVYAPPFNQAGDSKGE